MDVHPTATKSQRNVFSTLLTQYHEELRQYCRRDGVQRGTSRVHLTKMPLECKQRVILQFQDICCCQFLYPSALAL